MNRDAELVHRFWSSVIAYLCDFPRYSAYNAGTKRSKFQATGGRQCRGASHRWR